MAATSSAMHAASASAALQQADWATPLGAVSEADLPSCRTQLPRERSDTASSAVAGRSAAEQHASPRQYPSARLSKVWQLPLGDVMPAVAKVSADAGQEHETHSAHERAMHSFIWTARIAAWLAARAEEHAVSYEQHGPCRPSTKERRPAAIEWLLPVAAYTERPIGVSLDEVA